MVTKMDIIFARAYGHVENDNMPDALVNIRNYCFVDCDGNSAGPASEDEKLMAAYLAGAESATKED